MSAPFIAINKTRGETVNEIKFRNAVDYKNKLKTERRFGVILATLSSKECNRKDNL